MIGLDFFYVKFVLVVAY